jgi:diguanylate cyclase (GGDEF)-like protein
MLLSEKRGIFRLPWVILSGVLALVLLVGGNAFFDFQHESELLRQALEASETTQTLATLQVIGTSVHAGDWEAVHAEFERLERVLPNNQLWLTDLRGNLLADGQQAWAIAPVTAGQREHSRSIDPKIEWLSPNRILRVTLTLTNDQGQPIAILVNQADHRSQFSQLFQTNLWNTAHFFLLGLAFLVISLLVGWWLFVRPLSSISRISHAITQGTLPAHIPNSLVIEVQRIVTAFNEMIDHLAGQRASLERLNRDLEDTVLQRTFALEASNSAISAQAKQLDAINRLIASTAAVTDMPTLVRTALDQSRQIMQTNMGMVRINGCSAVQGIAEEEAGVFVGLISQAAAQSGLVASAQKLVVNDWAALPPGSPLSPLAQLMEKYGIRASISLPIFIGGRLAGEIRLADLHPRAWTQEEVALLEILTYHLGTATERTQSVEDIRAHNVTMHELVVASEQLNRMFTPLETLAGIGQGALTLSKADGLAIFISGAAGEQVCAWSWGLSTDFIEAVLTYARRAHSSFENENLADMIFQAPFLHSNDQPPDQDSPFIQDFPMGEYGALSAWPMVYQNQPIAFACCYYHQPRHWQEGEHEALKTFFRQAAAAFENARLFQAECTQRGLAEALRDVAATLTSTLDLNEVLDGILSNLGRVVPHDSAIIMLIEGEMLHPVRWQGIPDTYAEAFKTWRYPVRALYNRRTMLETVEIMVIPDTLENINWIKTSGLEWVRSYAGAPICQRGEVTGFIDVMSAQPGFFDSETGSILQAFASQAAIALENARLYSNAQQRMAETSALYRAVQPLFNPTEDISELARQITESVTQEFSSAHCSILLFDEERQRLCFAAQSGLLQLSAPELPIDGPGLTVIAARTGTVVYSPDVSLDPNYVHGADATRSELAIPLFVGDQVIGVMNLESTEVDAFDERGRRLLESFAEQAALGLENARLFATIRQNAETMARLNDIAQRRAQEAETIRQAATALSSTLDLQAVLDRILDQLERVVPHDSATIFLVEDEQRMRVWAVNNLRIMMEAHYYPRSNSLFAEIEKGMCPVALHDAQTDPRFCGWGGTTRIRSWMGVPLIRGGELVGILTLDRYERKVFKPEEMELAQAFANQAAIAVQNARLYASAQQRARELEALHTATTSLVSTLDLEKLLERILESVILAIPSTRAAAIHLLSEIGEMHLRVQHGLTPEEVQSPEWNARNSLWTWVLQELRPVLVAGSHIVPDSCVGIDLPETWANASLLIAPLVQEDEPLGLISLISPSPDSFTERDLHLLISFASTATAAIHNAQLHSAVQHLAITDPLTGIYNRRGFFELARRMLEEAQHFGLPISAIMIDIDFFKNVNDSYGHDAGDAVLRVLAERCRIVLRETDLICRYGGEEFAIVLSESDINVAHIVANRLFASITGSSVATRAGPVNVTISVGVASFGEEHGSLDHLLKRADQALYLAKGYGRNQVQVWSDQLHGEQSEERRK